MSRPAFWPKAIASDRPWTSPAIAIWLTILASCPEPLGPSSVIALANAIATGFAASNAAASPPHITVSAPFDRADVAAGDRRVDECRPSSCRRAPASSRATLAEAVVWSTKTAPWLHAGEGAVAPSVTERRSSSLPTQAEHESRAVARPRAAVGALAAADACLTQSAALAACGCRR